MHTAIRPASVLLIATLLVSCVENEEVIEVREDGSIEVVVAAASDQIDDLTDGYSVPLHGPWTPVDATTEAWVTNVGRDTGSPEVRSRQGAFPAGLIRGNEKLRLGARAVFASVEDWPEFLAPAEASYRTAYLRRSADLSIESRGGKTVYVFERTFHRRRGMRSVWIEIGERLPEDVIERIEDEEETPADMAKITQTVRDVYERLSEQFVLDALERIYTHGDASLPLDAHTRIVQSVRASMSRFLNRLRLADLLDATRAFDESEKLGQEPPVHPLTQFESDARDALRDGLTKALADEDGLSPRLRNGFLERLEWGFTAVDASSDLGDESFAITIAMPGVIVSGNNDGLDAEGRAVWRFESEDLMRGDLRMRVVSVVE